MKRESERERKREREREKERERERERAAACDALACPRLWPGVARALCLDRYSTVSLKGGVVSRHEDDISATRDGIHQFY
jgi:hypothetical protein